MGNICFRKRPSQGSHVKTFPTSTIDAASTRPLVLESHSIDPEEGNSKILHLTINEKVPSASEEFVECQHRSTDSINNKQKDEHNYLQTRDKNGVLISSNVSSASDAAAGQKCMPTQFKPINSTVFSSSNTIQFCDSSAYVFGAPRRKDSHSRRKTNTLLHNSASPLTETDVLRSSSKTTSVTSVSHNSTNSGPKGSLSSVPKVPEEGEKGPGIPPSSENAQENSDEEFVILSPPVGSDSANYLNLVASIFQLPIVLIASFTSRCVYLLQTPSINDKTADENWRRSLSQLCSDLYLKGGIGLTNDKAENSPIITIPNMSVDEWYKDFDCVRNDPPIIFFMASPLRASNGTLLGCLCLADFAPRNLDANNLVILSNLEKIVVSQLERDSHLALERANALEDAKRQEVEMMRALDLFDKAIMFVDTSALGWRILYTNQSWRRLSDLTPESVMGKQLQNLICAKGGAPINWRIFAAPLAARAELIVPKVVLRNKLTKVVSLKMRLATSESTVESIIAPGLPKFVKDRGNALYNYFVLIEEEVQEVDEEVAVLAAKSYDVLTKHVAKLPGLELSHMLGRGGFGSVYFGIWMGEPIAVKMIDNKLCKLNAAGNSIEAAMGMELDHLNIVRTLKFFIRSSNSRSNSSADGSSFNNTKSSSNDATDSSSKKQLVVAGGAPPKLRSNDHVGGVAEKNSRSMVSPLGSIGEGDEKGFFPRRLLRVRGRGRRKRRRRRRKRKRSDQSG
uniref:PAS domain-containing protein n=1 Tax=Polytomella parva TaxID=51329 RepID=A0A7S0VJJ1_9CHLO|mmetsp:Transcript_34653/g.62418  ORF Transcript_34653/g.62418 Transcript_34653/m.62418 type:complete len:738 (+) Transcript_34653:164-2377(+)